MRYKELLRVRNALAWYAAVWGLGFVATSLLTLYAGMGDVDHGLRAHATFAAPEPEAWPTFVAAAAFFAAIIATVLGSTLAQENDGHLELVLTRPRTRAQVVATAIAVDLVGIVAAAAIGLLFIMLHIAIFHSSGRFGQQITIVNGPDPIFNTLRY
ncbi:MAG TPA: hypothetical protein VEJ20_04250, partial [Candidatus Eremiobacteraceae bacterium]|nr:hypothetical protein [Candidatus Eremiobacteraceae bacterium]